MKISVCLYDNPKWAELHYLPDDFVRFCFRKIENHLERIEAWRFPELLEFYYIGSENDFCALYQLSLKVFFYDIESTPH